MYNNDRERIFGFVANVYHWLSACYNGESLSYGMQPAFPVIYVRGEFQPNAREAWREFSEHTPLSTFEAAIKRASDRDLESHGMVGSQLSYKLQVIEYIKEKAFHFSGWKKKLLDAIDTFLDSILSALGVGEALKELKDALVGSLDE
jgi:hypothetical protein